jgi:hypothetical protein
MPAFSLLTVLCPLLSLFCSLLSALCSQPNTSIRFQLTLILKSLTVSTTLRLPTGVGGLLGRGSSLLVRFMTNECVSGLLSIRLKFSRNGFKKQHNERKLEYGIWKGRRSLLLLLWALNEESSSPWTFFNCSTVLHYYYWTVFCARAPPTRPSHRAT